MLQQNNFINDEPHINEDLCKYVYHQKNKWNMYESNNKTL